MVTKLIPPSTSSATRLAATPLKGELLFDRDEEFFYYGDGVTQGGLRVTAGAFGLRYTYSVNIIAPPGSGELRFNNANPGLATSIYVFDNDRYGANVSSILLGLNTGSVLLILDESNHSAWALYTLSSVVDNTSYVVLNVVSVGSNGVLSGDISLTFANKGDIGATGSPGPAGDPGGPPGPQGDPGFSGFALPYSVGDGAVPATGEFLLNNADPSLATTIALSKTANGVNVGAVIGYISIGTLLQVSSQADPLNNWAFFEITAFGNNTTDYRSYTVAYLSHLGTVAGAGLLSFAPPGPQGPQGPAGDNGFSVTTRELWISSGAMLPASIDGAANGSYITATNPAGFDALTFPAGSETTAFFTLAMPQTWDGGTVKLKLYWTATAGSGAVEWGVQAGSLTDGATLDNPYGTAQEATDTLGTVDTLHISPATPALTIGGTPAAGSLCMFRVYRKANDTLTDGAILLGVALQIAETQAGTLW